MDSIHRLRVKIGQHEFEAEGTSEVVQQQFEAFKELVASSPLTSPAHPQAEEHGESEGIAVGDPKPVAQYIDGDLDKIMRVEGRVVSLTVPPQDVGEALLLILYGQKILRGVDQVTGSEVIDGLTATGGFSPSRVDRLLDGMGKQGDVIVSGERRGKRYRLTNTGLSTARQHASRLIELVP